MLSESDKEIQTQTRIERTIINSNSSSQLRRLKSDQIFEDDEGDKEEENEEDLELGETDEAENGAHSPSQQRRRRRRFSCSSPPDAVESNHPRSLCHLISANLREMRMSSSLKFGWIW